MIVRAAVPGDAAALADLAARTWIDEFGSYSTPEEVAAEIAGTRSEAYFLEALGRDEILVAESDGRLVGYVQFDDDTLHRLYVDTNVQGRGIGRLLAVAALEHPRLRAAQRVQLRVWERNERAVRLYESLGFRVVGTTSFTIGGGEPVDDLVMALEK